MLNRSASFAMSSCVLKALPGKLDIKRHSPSILYNLASPKKKNADKNTNIWIVIIIYCVASPSNILNTCQIKQESVVLTLNGILSTFDRHM